METMSKSFIEPSDEYLLSKSKPMNKFPRERMKEVSAKQNSSEMLNRRFFSIVTTQILFTAVILWSVIAQAQYDPHPAPGPYYFVPDTLGTSNQSYWRGIQNFGGIKTIANFNLLATVLGDDPRSLLLPGQTLVARETFNFGSGTVQLQPFAFTTSGSTKKFNLPLGANMTRFLDDPLGGAEFDLTLPFTDVNVALSNRSAIMRGGTDNTVWHIAVDFDISGNTEVGFDIVAPADGIVEGTTATSTSLAIRHTASNGKQFLTIYQHLVPESKQHLTNNTPVKRGQLIGHV